ncbi:hypothetical protein OEA41_000974 [Lepraria neglecta]|uniref:Uncharacterized protein n=1 Tax=Lepraria neglecta TaxID=209136 RepID=A0AAD9ZJJ0_9LECA|nr:hypothetical protein OEA41_000974 [Lepraria neglecta]
MAHFNTLYSRIKEYFHLNFYRVHVLYFIFTLLLSSIIIYGSGVDGNSHNAEARFRLRYIDALFLCTSAMTNTGLNTVNLSSLTGFQQSVLYILMLIGNITVVSIATVLVRRHYMRKHMQDFVERCEGGRKMVDDLERKENGSNRRLGSRSADEPNPKVKRRRHHPQPSPQVDVSTTSRLVHHERGHGGFPYPWEWSIARNLGSMFDALSNPVENRSHHYLSFVPSLDQKGRFHSLGEREHQELGGVEYRALGVLLWLIPLYIVFWLTISMAILVPWSYKRDVVAILQGPQPGGLNPGWWSSFLVVSGFCNVGLDLLDMNMIPFQSFYLVLIVLMVAKLAGNTLFPVFLRVVIWVVAQFVPTTSRLHHSLTFLLHHPRRCFILLFPSINTWYLAAVQACLHLGLWVFWFLLQIDYPTVWTIPAGQRTIAGLFQALGVRTAGMYIIPMSQVAPALLVLYTGAMYVSGLPIIISIRSTNIYEERSIGVQNTPKSEGNVSEKSYIAMHFQKQLISDTWWLFIGLFLICIIERTALATPSPGFDIYAILFDTVSAFGTVGLSTGVPYDTYSFCGAWHTLSKLILIVIMIRGRHRGLPMAIDRAVLLPGQELMEKMDREYNGPTREWGLKREKGLVREEERGSQAENEEEGQDPEQNALTAEKLHQRESQEAVASTA